MRVDLGGANRAVAEHLLDCAEIGPTIEKMGGEGMAEGVRTDTFFYTSHDGIFFYHGKERHACQFYSPCIEKEVVIGVALNQ